ncbi:hypothetical protein MRS44_010124 [Fusarium solani]|uniref:uncharacterized protein n=1 Tax=Fusarium solani TaxID=169388 RepID=UPI0032C433B0|nr:hypothetical protein MRS44_010124 [Fusarium solani]
MPRVTSMKGASGHNAGLFPLEDPNRAILMMYTRTSRRVQWFSDWPTLIKKLPPYARRMFHWILPLLAPELPGLLRRGLFAAASMSCPAYPTTASLSLHGRLLDDSTGVDYLVDKYMSAQLEMDEIMLKSAAVRSGEMLKSIDIQPCVTLLPRDSDRYTPELGFPFPGSVISENNQWLQNLVFFATHPSTVDEPSLTLPAKCRSWWQDQV